MACYLDIVNHDETEFANCLQLQRTTCEKLPMLFPLAMQLLSVTCTSVQVERLFSTGSLKMRLHKACTGAELLSALGLLKSNYRMVKSL